MLALLSRDWIGVPVAVLVAGAGGGLAGSGTVGATALGALAMAVGVLLAVGAVRHLVLLARERRENPPPGRLVGVGGHRMHVLAEGEAGSGPTVVWMAAWARPR